MDNRKKTALVVSDSRNVSRLLSRSLTPAGWELTVCSFAHKDLPGKLAEEPTMCVLDADGPPETLRSLLDALYTEHREVICLLLSHDTNSAFIRDLLAAQPLNNVIAKHGGISAVGERIDETELIVTCQKLYARDIFGLDKYMSTWGVEIQEHRVASTADKRAAMRALQGYLNDLDCFRSIAASVLWAADELVMNAMFNAPRDAEGNPKYVNHDRSQLELDPSETATLRYCCDGRYIAVSVTDSFGSLDRDVMMKYINRCLGEPAEIEPGREAGAGLGLYIVFNSITQLAFNIQPGVATEVIALFYVRGGPRAFNESGKSLNIFLLQ